ncbi:MAG TPA: MFS transporter [Ktedonobacterales bacterium]
MASGVKVSQASAVSQQAEGTGAPEMHLRRGTASYRRASLALFAGAFITYAVMYCTQPLLPIYTREFHITPAEASLSISVTTSALAITMLLAGSLAEAWGRKPVMTIALFATAILAVLGAFAPTFPALLVVRAVQGIVLAGVPAIAMAYLSEEVYAPSLGYAMGMMIGGNALGGMVGRISIGIVTDISSWRLALAVLGFIGLAAAVDFWRTLPPSRHFERRPLALSTLGTALLRHLRDPGLRCLYGIGFLLMGGFVTMYNYIGFHLSAPPYNLSQSVISWIFVLYLVGAFASTWMGHLADRFGRRRILWVGVAIMLTGGLVTLPASVPIKILGVAIFTFGFFAAHSIASSWVGLRATAERAQASALYLFFYYIGASVGGTSGGLFWAWLGWPGVIGLIAVFLIGAFAITLRLSKIPPVAAFPAR